MSEVPECIGEVCITCSDTAVQVKVVRLLEDQMAVVEGGAGEETVSVALVMAGVDAIFAHQIRFLADPADIALGIDRDGHSASVLAGLEAARELGLLTVALTGGDGGVIATSKAVDHLLVAASSDPRVVKEMHVTTYHVLWELVHVFFEQPGVLGPGVVT